MIDHIFGRPSPSWKRTQVGVQSNRCRCRSSTSGYTHADAQVFFVLLFWIWRLVYGREVPPRLIWLRKMNRALGPRINVLAPELRITDTLCTAHFSPWQIIVGTLTTMYASRNLDKLLGLGGTHILHTPFLSEVYPCSPLLLRWLCA